MLTTNLPKYCGQLLRSQCPRGLGGGHGIHQAPEGPHVALFTRLVQSQLFRRRYGRGPNGTPVPGQGARRVSCGPSRQRVERVCRIFEGLPPAQLHIPVDVKVPNIPGAQECMHASAGNFSTNYSVSREIPVQNIRPVRIFQLQKIEPVGMFQYKTVSQ